DKIQEASRPHAMGKFISLTDNIGLNPLDVARTVSKLHHPSVAENERSRRRAALDLEGDEVDVTERPERKPELSGLGHSARERVGLALPQLRVSVHVGFPAGDKLRGGLLRSEQLDKGVTV